MEPITHTEAFDLAYRFVTETNLNIFLTGKAGTGKTTFLKYLRQNSLKKMVVAAPTGVAAINAGGVTLHSLFQLPFTPFIPSKTAARDAAAINSHSLIGKIHYQKNKLDLLRNLELLVIDETSMVASHTIDAIDTILRSVKRRHHLPFGGTQILFIGDLYQLQPVVKNQEWEILKNYYASIFFFDSLVLKENAPVMIELNEIFRQQDNTFIGMLNAIRNNNLAEEHLNLLNSRLKPGFTPAINDEYITLTTHNNQANEINKRELLNLPGRSYRYKASIKGDFPEHQYPAEAEIELKIGAQVMFLKNDAETKMYFNGKIGRITELDEEKIKVKCEGDKQEIKVGMQEWKNVNFRMDAATREIMEEETGSFIQYPLRLAWAITIHKSQGLTFDKLIIDAENAFANGQVYVALSRCTSLEGLVLTSPVNRNFLGAHQNLKDWEGRNQNNEKLAAKFHISREQYIFQELQNIFTWNQWEFGMHELQKEIYEQKESITVDCFTWFEELAEKQKNLEAVAVKFKEKMNTLNGACSAIEGNEALQNRLKDAATYFSKEINEWHNKFRNHPIRVKTKKTARKIDSALEEIKIILSEILQKIDFCKKGFLLNEYLMERGKSAVIIEKISGSFNKNYNLVKHAEQPRDSYRETEHSGLYDKISELRNELSIAAKVPHFMIFSNNAIKIICSSLPGNKAALLNVRSFGKAKVKNYGDEIIRLVNDYCREKNIQPQEIIKKKSATVEETVTAVKSGKSIVQIAKDRNLATGTIESHIARAITSELINIEEVMDKAEVEKIAAYLLPKVEDIELSGLKERVPLDVSWGKLRIVLAWLQKDKRSA